MIILGIESSCDETAAAVLEASHGRFQLHSSIVASQIKLHAPYGGVVPELAARQHVEAVVPIIAEALQTAKIKPKQLDRIAVTVGPGLITSLQVGVETAKALSFAWQKPIFPVNHLHGHLYAPWLENKPIRFPVIALIVSGGHTEIIVMTGPKRIKKIGQTVDDAAGEAFDKVAQLLGLSYPGGPAVASRALAGNPTAFKLPRPMLKEKNFDFSFAGLKTAVLYTVQKHKKTPKVVADVCASFQQAAVEVLVQKTVAAARQYRAKTIFLSGGVAANKELRRQLGQAIEKMNPSPKFFVPPIQLCTDNAAMIAVAGYFCKAIAWQKIKAEPNLEI